MANENDVPYKELVELAFNAKERAYCPYSNFPVGAAVLCDDGSVVTGCNVENASYGLSICAERTALVKAASEGNRKIQAIAVASNMEKKYVAPCGACRQFIREFAGKNLDECKVITTRPDHSYEIRTIKELLPLDFGPEDLHDKSP